MYLITTCTLLPRYMRLPQNLVDTHTFCTHISAKSGLRPSISWRAHNIALIRYCSCCSCTLLCGDKGPLLILTHGTTEWTLRSQSSLWVSTRWERTFAALGMLSKASGIYTCALGTLHIDSQGSICNHSTLSLSQMELNFLVSWQVFLWRCEMEGGVESGVNEREPKLLQEGQHGLWFSIYSSAHYCQLTPDYQY